MRGCFPAHEPSYRARTSRITSGTDQPSRIRWEWLKTKRCASSPTRSSARRTNGAQDRSKPSRRSCASKASSRDSRASGDRSRQSSMRTGRSTSRRTTCIGSSTSSQTNAVRSTGCAATTVFHAWVKSATSRWPRSSQTSWLKYSPRPGSAMAWNSMPPCNGDRGYRSSMLSLIASSFQTVRPACRAAPVSPSRAESQRASALPHPARAMRAPAHGGARGSPWRHASPSHGGAPPR
ncbi:hypothetical protein MYXA107069_16750 [Myxococcus xanthus]